MESSGPEKGIMVTSKKPTILIPGGRKPVVKTVVKSIVQPATPLNIPNVASREQQQILTLSNNPSVKTLVNVPYSTVPSPQVMSAGGQLLSLAAAVNSSTNPITLTPAGNRVSSVMSNNVTLSNPNPLPPQVVIQTRTNAALSQANNSPSMVIPQVADAASSSRIQLVSPRLTNQVNTPTTCLQPAQAHQNVSPLFMCCCC